MHRLKNQRGDGFIDLPTFIGWKPISNISFIQRGDVFVRYMNNGEDTYTYPEIGDRVSSQYWQIKISKLALDFNGQWWIYRRTSDEDNSKENHKRSLAWRAYLNARADVHKFVEHDNDAVKQVIQGDDAAFDVPEIVIANGDNWIRIDKNLNDKVIRGDLVLYPKCKDPAHFYEWGGVANDRGYTIEGYAGKTINGIINLERAIGGKITIWRNIKNINADKIDNAAIKFAKKNLMKKYFSQYYMIPLPLP